jgi:hypothetical protein
VSAVRSVVLGAFGACGAFVLVLGGCSDRNEPLPVRAKASAIVGGAVDTSRPDVLLLRDDTAAGFRCTATLIAPNLVITARHCVGKRAVPAASTLCKGGSTDEGAQSLPSYQGDVDALPMYFSLSPSSAIVARGAKVYDDGSTTTCAHDVALIGLDRNVSDITPAKLRLAPLAQGDALVAMGFGWTDRNATVNATERMSGTTSVLALGPTVYSFKPLGDPMATSQPLAIAAGEVGVEGITMTGDSGGPAFDSSGRLAALVSRGYSDAYYGPGTFTGIAAHLATIDAALVATGNAPIADAGAPEPPDGGSSPDAADAGPPLETPPPDARDGGDEDPGFGHASSGCAVVARPTQSSRTEPDLAAAACVALAIAFARRRTTRGS